MHQHRTVEPMSHEHRDTPVENSTRRSYFTKWMTTKRTTLVVPSADSLAWSFIGAFVAMLCVGYVGLETELFPLFAPFGASAVLLYGPTTSPFSQPRSLIGGHVLSASVGVAMFGLFGASLIGVALGGALAVILMKLTKTIHPPAGATALLGATVSDGNVMWIVAPVLVGALIMLGIALVINNLDKDIRYPDFWI